MTGDRHDDFFESGSRLGLDEGGQSGPVSETVELSRGAFATARARREPTRRLALLLAGAVALGVASFAIVNAVRGEDSPASSPRPETAQAATTTADATPTTAADATRTTDAPSTTAASPVLATLVPVAAGDEGEDVRRLQEALAELGFAQGEADGIYGDATAGAVAAFQRSVGLAEDGIAGPATVAALNESLGRE